MAACITPSTQTPISSGTPLRLGLGSYALRWSLREVDVVTSCKQLIRTTKELGLDLLQIADNVALLELDPQQRRELRKLADDAGVRVEVGTDSYLAGDFRRMIRVAVAFDSRHIRLVGKDLRRLAQLLARVREDVTAWGGKVVVENYPPVPNVELLATLRAAGQWAGTCADTANSIPAGEWPMETLDRLLPLAHYVHVKDFQFMPGPDSIGWTLTGTPLGTGQQDVEAIVLAAACAAHHPDLILEHWLPWQGTQRATSRAERAWLEQGLHALRPLVQRGTSTERPVAPKA